MTVEEKRGRRGEIRDLNEYEQNRSHDKSKFNKGRVFLTVYYKASG